jgi:hypothetical protein
MSSTILLPLFTAELDTSALKRLLGVLEPVAVEVRADVRPDGIHFAHVDPSHVAMLTVEARRSLFHEYVVERPGALGVDIGKLKEVLKIPRGPARIRLEVDPAEPNRLRATVLKEGLAPVVRRMSIIDPSAFTEPQIPPLKPTIRAEGADAEAFAVAVRDARAVSDHATLHRSREGFVLEAWNGEGVQVSGAELTAGAVTGGGTASFPLDFLGKMATAVKTADTLTLAWGKEAAIAISFDTTAGLAGTYLLAPRVIDDGRDPDREAADIREWFGWSMRTGDVRAAPDPTAAAVDTLPDDVYQTELVRVGRDNALAWAKYAAERAEYEEEAARYAPLLAQYETDKAEAVARWAVEHPKSKKGPTRRWLPIHPTPPAEPRQFKSAEPFTDTYGVRIPDHKARRLLRGHPSTRVSWGPARPAPAPAERTIPALETRPPAEPMREYAEPPYPVPAEEDAPPFGCPPQPGESEPAPVDPEPEPVTSDPPPALEAPPVVAHVGAEIAEAFGMGPLVEAGLVVIEPSTGEPSPYGPVAEWRARAEAEPTPAPEPPTPPVEAAPVEPTADGPPKKRRYSPQRDGAARLARAARAPSEPRRYDPSLPMGGLVGEAAPPAPPAPAVSLAVPTAPDAPAVPPGEPGEPPEPPARVEMAASWQGWRSKARFRLLPRPVRARAATAPVRPADPRPREAPAADWHNWRRVARFRVPSRCAAQRHPTPGPSADARRLAA